MAVNLIQSTIFSLSNETVNELIANEIINAKIDQFRAKYPFFVGLLGKEFIE